MNRAIGLLNIFRQEFACYLNLDNIEFLWRVCSAVDSVDNNFIFSTGYSHLAPSQ